MSSQALLVLPGAAALVYVLAALFIKKSITAGASQTAVNLLVNLLPAVVFQALWLLPQSMDWADAWKPVVTGVTFLLGQVFTLLAWQHGEVSVTTPLLGTKVIFTAMFAAVLLGEVLPLRWWIGAVASSLGIFLVTGASPGSVARRLLRRDALYSLGAAATFGLTDVLVQEWEHAVGIAPFIAVMFGVTGVASLGIFVPRLRKGDAPRISLVPLAIGAGLYSLQILAMAIALGLHESATAVNVVYSSRAVWSVLLAFLLARALGSEERLDSRKVMLSRLAGAGLVFAAVFAVLIG